MIRNITDFPFQDYCELNDTELSDLAAKHNLRLHNSWMLPQIVAYYGTFEVYKTDSGTLDPRAIAKHNIGKHSWNIGLWRVVNRLRRSALVRVQNTPQSASYSALVPLILSGLKCYKNVPYSAWGREGLEILVDPQLHEAMTFEVDDNITREEILEARELGLTVKSGSNAGTVQAPTSVWKLKGLRGTALDSYPPLVSTMLTQIWVAHPSLRSQYMILDPRNWDHMPDPLISTEVITPPTTTTKPAKSFYSVNDLPWA